MEDLDKSSCCLGLPPFKEFSGKPHPSASAGLIGRVAWLSPVRGRLGNLVYLDWLTDPRAKLSSASKAEGQSAYWEGHQQLGHVPLGSL